MPKVEIYTTSLCGFCFRAKQLLKRKNILFREYDVTSDENLRQEMIQRAGSHFVPQIFINDEHIGGSDELSALELNGELDKKLG
ncbi:MAG: glutaredoxin 3 [Gammaproteobacteria bacterium]|nr:glutaredoxin 3 [Gammaproteobacteria bacterium]